MTYSFRLFFIHQITNGGSVHCLRQPPPTESQGKDETRVSTLANPLNTSQKWLAGFESLATADRSTNTAYSPPEDRSLRTGQRVGAVVKLSSSVGGGCGLTHGVWIVPQQ